MKIALVTYQTEEAVAALHERGVLHLRKEDEHLTHLASFGPDTGFSYAYRFIIQEMRKRLPKAKTEDTCYPIWAWQKIEGKNPPTPYLDYIHRGKVRLRIFLDEERILSSDFDMFSYLLSGGLYFNLSKEDELKYGKDIFAPEETFYPNLEAMFNLHRKKTNGYAPSYRMETIQATFWELYPEDVIDSRLIPADMKEPK